MGPQNLSGEAECQMTERAMARPSRHAAWALTGMRRAFSLAAADFGKVTVIRPLRNVAPTLSLSIPRGSSIWRSKWP
jgi:hypothetical protein